MSIDRVERASSEMTDSNTTAAPSPSFWGRIQTFVSHYFSQIAEKIRAYMPFAFTIPSSSVAQTSREELATAYNIRQENDNIEKINECRRKLGREPITSIEDDETNNNEIENHFYYTTTEEPVNANTLYL